MIVWVKNMFTDFKQSQKLMREIQELIPKTNTDKKYFVRMTKQQIEMVRRLACLGILTVEEFDTWSLAYLKCVKIKYKIKEIMKLL